MGRIGNFVCKTVGIAGVSAVLYDAFKVGSKQSYRTSQQVTADKFESIVAAQRTNSNESHVSSAIQNKVADLRMSNPVIPFFGRIKGFISGTLDSLGNNFIPVIFSSLAILTKGFTAKLGAWGLVGCGLYTVLKEGFGMGKNSPIDKG